MELVVFYFAAVVAVGGGLMMILQRNPVASVLYLIVTLMAIAVMFVQLSAIFVGALLIIVYAGAILVLFLFVIMLLNLRGEKFAEKRSKVDRPTRVILTVVFVAELLAMIKQVAFPGRMNTLMVQASPDFGGARPVAELLYTKYLFPFELTSILLLVAIVGAVIMAKRDEKDDGRGV
ncbi:NADH-ubiquinone/plastoquinone oxidoreductase chain 6 [Candidatus Zixiibacteriota bacterium]|nr:NADH-ubiquinone/plastoquinone oxidoreductase chain 6 [candidate division Zixibacteria bacterium]